MILFAAIHPVEGVLAGLAVLVLLSFMSGGGGKAKKG